MKGLSKNICPNCSKKYDGKDISIPLMDRVTKEFCTICGYTKDKEVKKDEKNNHVIATDSDNCYGSDNCDEYWQDDCIYGAFSFRGAADLFNAKKRRQKT